MPASSTPLAADAPARFDTPGEFAAHDERVAEGGLAASALAAWHELRCALHERAHLLTLEVRLAGLTFVQLVLYAVLAAVLVVSAWIGLMGALVFAIVSWWGVHWAMGLVIGVVLNLALAAWLVHSMIVLLQRLDLQASLRRLQGRTPAGE